MALEDVIRRLSLRWDLASGHLSASRPVLLTAGEQIEFFVSLKRGSTPETLPANATLHAVIRLADRFDDDAPLDFSDFEVDGDEEDGNLKGTATVASAGINDALDVDDTAENDLTKVEGILTLVITNDDDGDAIVAHSLRVPVTVQNAGIGAEVIEDGGDLDNP